MSRATVSFRTKIPMNKIGYSQSSKFLEVLVGLLHETVIHEIQLDCRIWRSREWVGIELLGISSKFSNPRKQKGVFQTECTPQAHDNLGVNRMRRHSAAYCSSMTNNCKHLLNSIYFQTRRNIWKKCWQFWWKKLISYFLWKRSLWWPQYPEALDCGSKKPFENGN